MYVYTRSDMGTLRPVQMMIFIACAMCAQGRLRVGDHNNVPMGGAIWRMSSIYLGCAGITDHGSLPLFI